jgi:glycosyltransferase involved in cell wall biosynthesis
MVALFYRPRLGKIRAVTSALDRARDAGGVIEVADLSVAMCTRNGAHFVAEQVRSILTQSVIPRELVVGDDASSDDTLAIIEATVAEVRAENPAVTTQVLITARAQPLGVTKNFEQTIAACTSALIALSDQDDVWPPGRLARLVAVFDDPAVNLVHSDARLVDAGGHDTGVRLLRAMEATTEERRKLVAGDAFNVLLRRNLVTGATVIMRRALAESAMPFPMSWLHDEWLAAIAAATGSVRLIDEPWLDYRQHGDNEVGASAPTWSRRWAKLREPRGPRAARLIARSRALVNHLESAGAAPARRQAAKAKLEHEQCRAQLPGWPLFRVPGILAGLVAGRYWRFNRGLIDVLRDLVQPATKNT